MRILSIISIAILMPFLFVFVCGVDVDAVRVLSVLVCIYIQRVYLSFKRHGTAQEILALEDTPRGSLTSQM